MVESVFLGRELRTSDFKKNSSVQNQEAKLMVSPLVLFVASRPVGQDPVATMSKVALSRREPKQKNKAKVFASNHHLQAPLFQSLHHCGAPRGGGAPAPLAGPPPRCPSEPPSPRPWFLFFFWLRPPFPPLLLPPLLLPLLLLLLLLPMLLSPRE